MLKKLSIKIYKINSLLTLNTYNKLLGIIKQKEQHIFPDYKRKDQL